MDLIKKSRSWDRALSDSEESLSDVDCKAVKVFLNDFGEGNYFRVGFRNIAVCSRGEAGLLGDDVAKQ